ncbi:MAG: DUF167 domain-containing protein [Desulfobacterales bacterium]
MLYFKESPEGIIFKVRVQPRSSKNMVAGLFGDALKVKLTAPPVEGAANSMCIKYLSKWLSVPQYLLEIVSGQSCRTKYILFRFSDKTSGNEPEMLKSKIKSLAA